MTIMNIFTNIGNPLMLAKYGKPIYPQEMHNNGLTEWRCGI